MFVIWYFDLTVQIFSLVTFLWDWIDLMLRSTSKLCADPIVYNVIWIAIIRPEKKIVFFFRPQHIRCINIVANGSFFKGPGRVCLYGSLICSVVLLCAVYKADVSVIGTVTTCLRAEFPTCYPVREETLFAADPDSFPIFSVPSPLRPKCIITLKQVLQPSAFWLINPATHTWNHNSAILLCLYNVYYT